MQKVIDDDLLAFMGEQESQYLITPSSLSDEVKKRLAQGEDVKGDRLPWSKTHNFVRLRQGEVSVWAGINGHGKSQLINQVCAWGLSKKWLIASMEMLPAETMKRMMQQISGSEQPADSYVDKLLNWTDNKLWLYDQTDTIASERILALVRYAVANQIDHVVIDSLMKCGIRKDDLEGQSFFVDKLCWLAKANKIHVHLVHHIRKGESERKIPNKFDIRGAGEITDLVDNIFIIHRNIKKEEEKEDDETEPDTYLKLAKQRNGKFQNTNFKLWFNKTNGQFIGDPNRTMTHWVNN